MQKAATVWLSTLAFAILSGAGIMFAQSAQPKKPPTPSVPQPSSSEADSAPASDWIFRCDPRTDGAGAPKTCEIAQTLQVAGQGTVAQVAVGRLSSKDKIVLTVELPPNVTLASRVKVVSAAKEDNTIELQWARCVNGGCFAEAELDEDAFQSWRPAKASAQIRYVTGAGQTLVINLSLRGFSPTFENLLRTTLAKP